LSRARLLARSHGVAPAATVAVNGQSTAFEVVSILPSINIAWTPPPSTTRLTRLTRLTRQAQGERREARGDATAERVARVEILSVDAG
jgi:hypothetical protein